MKKIYMILAAITLLSMSLNAQTVKATKNVFQHSTSTGKVDTPLDGIKKAPKPAIYRAPSRADRGYVLLNDDIDGSKYSTGSDIDNNLSAPWSATSLRNQSGGVLYIRANGSMTFTVPSGYSNTNFKFVFKTSTSYYSGYFTFTPSSGSAKQVTTSAASTEYECELTGLSSGNTVTITGKYSSYSYSPDFMYMYVYVDDGGSGSQTATLDLFDTTMYVAQVLPVYGYWHDAAQHNQMIYPASLLTNMVGKKIKSMTFYPASYNNYSGINFYNGSVTFKLKEVTGSTGFDSSSPSLITGTMTTVKTVNMPSSANTSATTWLIQFDQDYKYNGGDLVIDVTTTAGDYGYTYFYIGTTSSLNVENPGYLSYSSNTSAIGYVPQVTFTYEQAGDPTHDLSIALTAPTTAGAGSTIDVTATVTNNGDFAENGYTVTVTDGTNIVNITAQEELGIGETATFTVQFTTSTNAAGQTVNYTATVACTDDAVATNNTATASTSLLACPPPENVAATGSGQSGTMTWDAPTITPPTVNEGFDDTSVFPSLSIGGITATVHTGTIGGWTVYTPSGDYVYAPQNASFTNMQAPQAWTVMNPTAANWNIDTPHSGSQFMVSFCDSGDENFQNIQTTNHWLISPELSGAIQTITFWERVITTQYGDETYEVLASSTDNNPSSFSVVQSFTSDATTWTQRQVTLPAGTKYFAIKHTSYDIFGVMIDDVTYVAAPVSPISYNIYLDGVLIDNVPSTTFSYTFNNVSTGQHQCAVSAVYSYGESVAVPATFNTKLTPNAPTVSSVDGTTSTTITITPDPNTDGQLSYYVIDQNGQQTQNLEFPRGEQDYTVTVHAHTTEGTNYLASAETVQPVTIPALPQTTAPSISYETVGDNVVITATGNGTVTLTIPGYPEASGTGSASITVPRHMQDYAVTATATAQEADHLVSDPTTQEVPIPGLASEGGWMLMEGTYTNGSDQLSFTHRNSDNVVEPILFVDQFNQSTMDNNHPDEYLYKVSEKVSDDIQDARETSEVPVHVHKTYSKLNAIYTEAEILADEYGSANELRPNVINGTMSYDIKAESDIYFYGLYRGNRGEEKPAAVDDLETNSYRISKIQKDLNEDFFNENMLTNAVVPKYNHIEAGDVERIDKEYVDGVMTQDQLENNFLAYVPVIWSYGDHTGRPVGNNSYGSDIKVTRLGNVSATVGGFKSDGSATGEWEYNGTTYCVYTPIIDIYGIMPEAEVAPDKDTHAYEPYMYRVWCLYEGARNFKHAPNDNGHMSLADDGELHAPFLIGEVRKTDDQAVSDHETIGAALEHMDDQAQWSFGAPAEEGTEDEMEFIIRFYYKKTVTDAPHYTDGGDNGGAKGLREGDETNRQFYVVETSGTGKDIQTAINEMFMNGEVVSRTYVNAQGMQSDVPFDGLNIVVTRYSDGTTSTTKVVR